MPNPCERMCEEWRAALESGSAETLARVIGDLAGCDETVRPQIARRFVAMLCGPGVPPSRAAAFLAQAEADRESGSPVAALSTPELGDLRIRGAGLEARLKQLERSAEAEPPDPRQDRELEAAIALQRERLAWLEDLLRQVDGASAEISEVSA